MMEKYKNKLTAIYKGNMLEELSLTLSLMKELPKDDKKPISKISASTYFKTTQYPLHRFNKAISKIIHGLKEDTNELASE